MGKVFKILKEVLLIGSFAVLFVALIIGGITLDASDLLVSEGFRQFGLLLAGFVGLFLMHSSHDVANKVGTGLAIGTMILVINFGLMFIDVGLAGDGQRRFRFIPRASRLDYRQSRTRHF